MVTMLLGGLWHGAGWGFVVWGAMHGFGLAVERLLNLRKPVGSVRMTWWFVTQIWVTIAWIFFREPDVRSAAAFIGSLWPKSADSLIVHSELWIGFVFAAAVVLQQTVQLVTARHKSYAMEILAVSTVIALTFGILVHSPPKVFIYFKF